MAVGECLYIRHAFRKFFKSHASNIVQPNVGNTGGIMEVKKIAAIAEAYNMRVALHNCGSALLTAASLEIAACIPNFMTQETIPTSRCAPVICRCLSTHLRSKSEAAS